MKKASGSSGQNLVSFKVNKNWKQNLLAFTFDHGDFRFQLIKGQLHEIYIQYEFSTGSYSTMSNTVPYFIYST